MPIEWFATGNSGTRVAYDTSWRVLDVGSGHNPHPRADVLMDRFLLDNDERSGQPAACDNGRALIVGDACAMPFRDGAFDFAICSHVAEHVDDPEGFGGELNRVSRGGYVETPSKLAEMIRPQPFHKWFVSAHNGTLVFRKKPALGLVRWYQRLFFSLYFYKTGHQLEGKRVLAFSHGCRKPCHYFFASLRRFLQGLWVVFRTVTYTRLLYHDGFDWAVEQSQGAVQEQTEWYLDKG